MTFEAARSANLRQGKLARYKFIKAEKSAYPVKLLCRVRQVRRCDYYAYERDETYRENPQTTRIKECFHLNARRYGSIRIAASLKIGRNTVRKVTWREGWRAIAPKSFKPQTTDSKQGLGANDNLLQDRLNEPTAKGAILVGDITYLPMQNGSFCYLACLQDKYTRRIASVESFEANDGAVSH